MAEGEQGGKGGARGGTPKRRMIVRWGKATFVDVEPGDSQDTGAAEEGAAQNGDAYREDRGASGGRT